MKSNNQPQYTVPIFFAVSLLFARPSYPIDAPCPPYLISNNELTAILKSNIGKAPLSNAKASANPGTSCEIKLSATVDLMNLPVDGCASPIYDDYSIGLSDIKIHTPLQDITIPSGKSNIKDKIIQHCGREHKIKSTQIQPDGVLMTF